MPSKKKPDPVPSAPPVPAAIAIHCQYDRLAAPAALRFNPANNNTHPPEQLQRIATVFREIGIRHPVIVSRRSGMVVVGEGRARAAMLLPGCQVPVSEQAFASESEELAFLAADNQLPELSTRDESRTAALIAKIKAAAPAFNLEATGYADREIKRMMNAVKERAKRTDIKPAEFGILIYAVDENSQKETFERLTAEGHRCKIVCS